MNQSLLTSKHWKSTIKVYVFDIKKTILAFIVICYSCSVYGQYNVDSLKDVLNSDGNETLQIERSFDYFKLLIRNDPTSAFYFLKKGTTYSERASLPYWKQMAIHLSGHYYERIGTGDSADYYYSILRTWLNEKQLLIDQGPVCLNIANHLSKKSAYQEALHYSYQGKVWFQSQADYAGLSKSHNTIGVIFRKQALLDSALWHYKKSAFYLDQIEKPEHATLMIKGITYMNIGIVYAQQGLNEKALEYFLKSMAVKEEIKDYNGLARSYMNTAVLYNEMENDEKKMEYNRKAMKMAEDMQLFLTLGQIYNNIGNHYAKRKSFDSALYYHKKALKNRETYSNPRLIALSQNNLGNVYRDMGNYTKALLIHQSSLTTRLEIGDQRGIATSYQNIGTVYNALGNTSQAYHMLLKADSLASAMGLLNEMEDIKLELSRTAASLDNYISAYHYRNQAAEIRDSLTNRTIDRKVYELEKKHELRGLEKKLTLQEVEIQAKKNIIYAGILVIILLATVIYFAIARARVKSESVRLLQEKNEKIETLMRELHHRVKNNLQVISSLLGLQSMKLSDPRAKEAIEEGKSRVRAMSMIHQRLYTDKNIISIDFDEYTKDLVHELKSTYQPNRDIKLELNIPEINFDVDTTLPLGLVLNELITNAFKYAYEDIQEPLLKVELIAENHQYKLIIADNGPGLCTPIDLKNAKSFGLKLVNLLVHQMKGSIETSHQHGLSYQINFVAHIDP